MQGGANEQVGPNWARMWDKSRPTDTNPLGAIVPDELKEEVRLCAPSQKALTLQTTPESVTEQSPHLVDTSLHV